MSNQDDPVELLMSLPATWRCVPITWEPVFGEDLIEGDVVVSLIGEKRTLQPWKIIRFDVARSLPIVENESGTKVHGVIYVCNTFAYYRAALATTGGDHD